MNICCKDGMDKLIEFFQRLGIECQVVNRDEYGFSRTIRFYVNNESYDIVWYINDCVLKFKGIVAHFRYVIEDDTYPENCDLALSFLYDEEQKWSDVRLLINA